MLAIKSASRWALATILVSALGLQAWAEDAVRWRKDLEEAKQEAAQSGRLVLLHFYGTSCAPCAKLDKEVFSQKQASDALEACYVPIKVNVDHSMAIASAYNVTSWPTDVVITPTGQVVAKFVSPQGIQPYLIRMDQVAVATRDQAAAGLVSMGKNGTNPYSNIAVPAAGAAATTVAAAPNNNYAAPTQYQESVPAQGSAAPQQGATYNPQGGVGYAPQGGSPYSPGPSQDPYNKGNPYGPTNNAAAPQAQTADRYGNVVGDRYATPQYGAYDPSATPGQDRYAPVDGNYNANPQNPVAGTPSPYDQTAGAPPAQSQPAPGTYAPPAGPQIQQNPYSAPSQDRYATGAAGTAAPAATPTGYDPNQRYSSAPAYSPAGTIGADPQVPAAPANGADPRYAGAPQYGPPQQAAPAGGYNPATNYNQAPPMNPATAAPAGPALEAPAQSAPPVANPSVGAPSSNPPAQQVSGNPAFGLDGFCPVALAEKQRWIQGDKAWGAIHLGKTYLFISQENQQKFLANPDAYAPVLSGHDPVLIIERNVQTPGSRSHGVFYRDHVYLFSGEETLAAFGKDPERYANGVRQAMLQNRAPVDQRR